MSELFLELFNRAMAAGWLVLAVLLLRLALKKAPRWIHCLLWALVALRLVWPFSLESAVSLLPSREVLPPEMLYAHAPAIHTGIEFVNSSVNQSFTPAMMAEELTSVNPLQIWTWLAGWIWAIGAAVLLGYALVSWLRLRKQVAVSVEEDGLWRCDAIDSPFILGVFRPGIYVPSSLTGESLCHVAAHERAHLIRRDHWWKPLGYLLLTVFWFHPLLWAAYVLLCRDIELACDEKVVRDLDASGKKAYSMALVDCAVNHRTIAACPVAFGEVGVKTRVQSVLHYKKPAFWVIVIALVLCVALAVCFLTDPVGYQPDFDREDIALAQTMDLRLNSGLLTGELNEAQIDELWSRLRDLKDTKPGDVYGGFTPFYSLSIQLTDGQWIRLQGYALDASRTDLVCGDQVYQIKDAEFQAYLDRICAGGDKLEAEPQSGEDIAAVETPDSLEDGSVYITTECIFLNPLSSALAQADSGFFYRIDRTNGFEVWHRRSVTGKIFDMDWQWQELPFTEEEWNAKFWVEPVDISGYTERLYRQLEDWYYLLSLDGQLWLVEEHGGELGIWSIYRLERAESFESARWSYMEGVDAEHRPFSVLFDFEFEEILVSCDGGTFYGCYDNVNDDVGHYYGDQILYWSPLPDTPDEANLSLEILREDGTGTKLTMRLIRDLEADGAAYRMNVGVAGLIVSMIPHPDPYSGVTISWKK